jgi:hypothetical protein
MSAESTEKDERAVVSDSSVMHERAVVTESTDVIERASASESTAKDERAMRWESAIEHERAATHECTDELERAATHEYTGNGERLIARLIHTRHNAKPAALPTLPACSWITVFGLHDRREPLDPPFLAQLRGLRQGARTHAS